MYARGMSQRDISATIEDIYGFSMSHEMISEITDSVLTELEEWRNRPLKKCYAFVFVDCLYVTLRREYEAKECAVYVVLGYDIQGKKEILGLWTSESESKNYWMQIFDEIRSRGVEDLFFISMDGVSRLEAGAKAIFPQVVVQRCLVHMIRNSIKYVPAKEYKRFTQSLRKVYGAINLKAANTAFEQFCKEWASYPGAIGVWERNYHHVEQLYDYSSAVRKIMYTTNAIEAVNSSFRKVTKKGAFPMVPPKLRLPKHWARIKAPSAKKSNYTASNPSLSVIRLTVLYSPNAKTETLSSAILNALPISSSLVSAEIVLQGPVTVVRSIHAVTMINTDTLLRRRTASIVTALSVLGSASMQRFLRSRNSAF